MQAYIDRIESMEFDAEISQKFLRSESDLAQKYLISLVYAKLVGRSKGMNADSMQMIDLSNVILDHLDFEKDYLSDRGGNMIGDVVQALYFNVILKSTSMFFFRSRHLLRVLDIISEPKYY